MWQYANILPYCDELYFIRAIHSGASFRELYIQMRYVLYSVLQCFVQSPKIHRISQREKYTLKIGEIVIIREIQVKRSKWFVQSVVRRMNRQDSAEGDVVKREDGVARAFGFNLYQPAGYLGIF